METVIKVFQALVSLWSVIIAVGAAKRGVASSQEQALNTRVDRWLKDFGALVRDPARLLIEQGTTTICHVLERAFVEANALNKPTTIVGLEELVQRHCQTLQLNIVELRDQLLRVAFAADEHELAERLSRKLDTLEDELMGLLLGLEQPGMRQDCGAFLRAARRLFVPLNRTVIQYGKEVRTRMTKVPLKRSTEDSQGVIL